MGGTNGRTPKDGWVADDIVAVCMSGPFPFFRFCLLRIEGATGTGAEQVVFSAGSRFEGATVDADVEGTVLCGGGGGTVFGGTLAVVLFECTD
jgi:hypothetical protein